MTYPAQEKIKSLRREKYRIARTYCTSIEARIIRDWTIPHFILYMHQKIDKYTPTYDKKRMYEIEAYMILKQAQEAEIIK